MRLACHLRQKRYYDTSFVAVPVPATCIGSSESRERHRMNIEKQRFSITAPKRGYLKNRQKTAVPGPRQTVIERGVSGHPLSLQTTGRAKDSDHAEREHRNEPHFNPPASAPSGTASIVGRIGPVARDAVAWREPPAASGTGSPRAPVFRSDRVDLTIPIEGVGITNFPSIRSTSDADL